VDPENMTSQRNIKMMSDDLSIPSISSSESSWKQKEHVYDNDVDHSDFSSVTTNSSRLYIWIMQVELSNIAAADNTQVLNRPPQEIAVVRRSSSATSSIINNDYNSIEESSGKWDIRRMYAFDEDDNNDNSEHDTIEKYTCHSRLDVHYYIGHLPPQPLDISIIESSPSSSISSRCGFRPNHPMTPKNSHTKKSFHAKIRSIIRFRSHF
jgi:hypothetical protein